MLQRGDKRLKLPAMNNELEKEMIRISEFIFLVLQDYNKSYIQRLKEVSELLEGLTIQFPNWKYGNTD